MSCPGDRGRCVTMGRVTWFEAIVLGVVQGLTEFLPISSSAHLLIVGQLFFDGRDPGAAFTAVTQIGTESAVIVYFAKDIWRIISRWSLALVGKLPQSDPDVRMGWMVIVGSLPIAVLGLLFEGAIDSGLRNLWITAAMLAGVAIVLAVLLFFRRNWWPHGAVLGNVPELGGWHSVAEHPSATQLPDVVVFRWEAPLFFANAGQFRDQVRNLAKERRPDWIVLQCEAITDIDVTAAEVLRDLDEELNNKGVHLSFVEMRDRLQVLVRAYGLNTTLDQEHFYPSLERALADVSSADGDIDP